MPWTVLWTTLLSIVYYCEEKYILPAVVQLITVQYKILDGENLGEFGELQEICQNFLVQNFPF